MLGVQISRQGYHQRRSNSPLERAIFSTASRSIRCFPSDDSQLVIKYQRESAKKRAIVGRQKRGYHVGHVTSYHGLLTKWPPPRLDMGSSFGRKILNARAYYGARLMVDLANRDSLFIYSRVYFKATPLTIKPLAAIQKVHNQ